MSKLPVNPIDDPSAWDSVEFAGIEWPWCEVDGFDRENNWDVQAGKGAFGATTKFTGIPPAKGSITFLAWEAEHFDQFASILELFRYDPAKKRTLAAEIWHPAIVENDVHTVVCTKKGIWKHEGEGKYTRTMEFLEYRPPPKVSAVATPTSTTENPSGPQPDPAIVAAQNELNAALGDAKALGPP